MSKVIPSVEIGPSVAVGPSVEGLVTLELEMGTGTYLLSTSPGDGRYFSSLICSEVYGVLEVDSLASKYVVVLTSNREGVFDNTTDC